MASVWLTTRRTSSGAKRYRVEFRTGGREAPMRYGGSFRTKREALARKVWIAGELAALRIPNLRALTEKARPPTLAKAADRWHASRLDLAEATRRQHRVDVKPALRVLGDPPVDELTADDVAELVSALAAAGFARDDKEVRERARDVARPR